MRWLAVALLGSSLVVLGCGGAAPSSAPESASAPAAAMAPRSVPDPRGAPDLGGATEPVTAPTAEGGGPGDSVGTSKQSRSEPPAEAPMAITPPSPPPPKPSRKRSADATSRSLSDEKDDARPLAAVAEASGERISRDALAGVVDANLERFRPCATGDAKVELRLTLSGGGAVTKAEARSSQPDDARLRDCVVDVLRGLSFPRGAVSDTSTVSFQLVLSRPAF